MKKRTTLLFALCLSQLGFALPVGNPMEPGLLPIGVGWQKYYSHPCKNWFNAWSLRVGFYGDFVFDRMLSTLRTNESAGISIRDAHLDTYAAYLALNIADHVDAYGTIGATHIKVRSGELPIFSLTPIAADLDFETDLSWSVGGRGIIWEWCHFNIGVEGQYFQTRPKLSSFTRLDTESQVTFQNPKLPRYWEWQVGFGVSYYFGSCNSPFSVAPYAAVKWSHSKLEMNDFTFRDPSDDTLFSLSTLESRYLWGYAFGASFNFFGAYGATLECRLGDEKAVYLNTQFRF